MDPIDTPKGDHFITDWIPPSKNINSEWRDSSFKLINESNNQHNYWYAGEILWPMLL